MAKRRRPGREHPITGKASVSTPATSGWYKTPVLNVIDKLQGAVGSYALTEHGRKLLREVIDTLNEKPDHDGRSLLLLADKVRRAQSRSVAESISTWHDLADIRRGLMEMADERLSGAPAESEGGTHD